jgi:hypothetical protein
VLVLNAITLPPRLGGHEQRFLSFMFDNFKKWIALTPPPTFVHPTLGSFEHDNGIWTGCVQGMELCLAGNASHPNESLVLAASTLLDRFPAVKDTALAFLVSQSEAPSKDDFTCYDLELLYEESPNHFALRFMLCGDHGGMWRVEFEDGTPLFLTRDD